MANFSLQSLKNEIKKSGTSKGKLMFFKEDKSVRVRFLTDLEDGLEILFHDSFQLGVNVPCQENFGRECEYCDNDDLRSRKKYAWCVYDYESKEVKIILEAVNNCSPVPSFVSLYESLGTLTDRDYEIKQTGKGQNKTFTVIPMEKRQFRGGAKIKALSEQAMLKIIDKAFPADNNEDFGTDKKKTKPKAKKEVEKEEDDWDDEEKTSDYEEMSAKELYTLCKERDIDCKPKKTKEYYIDLLEEADEEQGNDDWDDEEEEDDWDE